MADPSRDPREHWLKWLFWENEVANSGYITFYIRNQPFIYEKYRPAMTNFHAPFLILSIPTLPLR